MDKNTLTGLLCMAAIFFGFMYFNRPSEEQIEAQKAAEAARAAAAARPDSGAVAITADTLNNADWAALCQAVKTLGQAEQGGSYTFVDEKFSLRLDSTVLTGTVTAGTTGVDITALRSSSGKPVDEAQFATAVKAVRQLTSNVQKYKDFARNIGGANTQTVLENEKIRLTIDSRGAMISQAELKNYNTEVTEPPTKVQLFRGDNDGYSFTFNTNDQRIDTRTLNFTPVVESDTSVFMALNLNDGAAWGIRYTLRPDSYIVGMAIVQKGMERVLPQSTSSIAFNWHQKMARNEKGRTFEERNSGILYKYVGDSPDELDANKDDVEEANGRIKWVAFKNQFFSSVIIARDHFTNANLSSLDIKDNSYLKDLSMASSLPYTVADGSPAGFDFYLGPNDYSILSKLDDQVAAGEDLNLTRLIPLGWGLFRWINVIIVIPVFNFLSSFISSYGIIILLLTIFIKLILFPFTYKSFKSQARMRVLQPEIKEINDKYPGQENAMRRQQETMALYSRAGASPFSGCLPMLLQMPVLIAMFSFFPSAIELRGQSFLWAHDLSAPDMIIHLPFTIPFYGNGVSLFCLLMTVVNIVYARINMQNQPGGNSMPGMKWMMYLMPVMFLFWFNDYASGLSYYYLVSLLITIVQTWAFRHFVDEDKVRAEMMANAKKPRKKSGWMARLEEAQRQQQAAMRAQQKQGKRR